MLSIGHRWLLIGGFAIGLLIAGGSPLISAYFRVPVQLLIAGSVGVPFVLALPLLIGELQGEQRFTACSAISAGQAALKLIAAIALGTVLGPLGVVLGISIASILTYLVCARLLRRKLRIRAHVPWIRTAASYLSIVLPSTLALGVLLSVDVLVVKHYFPTEQAGQYSAVAAIGRAIFWGASGVAIVLFPKAVVRSAHGRTRVTIVAVSLLLVVIGGLTALAVLNVASGWLLRAFSGSAYVAGMVYLPWYAVGMTLLGAVAVLNAAHQSIGKPGFLVVLLPSAVVEPALLVAFHKTLIQVVQVVDLSMALAFVGLGAWYLMQERSRRPHIEVPPDAVALQPIAQVQVNR